MTSPVPTVPEWDALVSDLGDKAVTIDCTFDIDGPDDFTTALERTPTRPRGRPLGLRACDAFDRAVSDMRCPILMIPATGAVHSHLVRQQLRTFASVNVATGECLDVHHFAVLIGVGATTINAYIAEEAIAERHDRGLLPKLTLPEAIANYRKAVEDGLLKIMSKMASRSSPIAAATILFSACRAAGGEILPADVVADFRPRPDRYRPARVAEMHRKVMRPRTRSCPSAGSSGIAARASGTPSTAS